MIENTNKQIEAEQKEQTLLESNLKRSDIYIHFHQAAKNQTNITAAEWNDLQAMIDQTYGMFTKHLISFKTHGQQGGPEKWDQFIQAF